MPDANLIDTQASDAPGTTLEREPNTYFVEVDGAGLPEVDGLFVPSTAPPAKSESGTVSSVGYWNGRPAWDRADGKAARSPSLSYSNSYKSWRISHLDGHLAYHITCDDDLPPTDREWDVYKIGVAPAPQDHCPSLRPQAPLPRAQCGVRARRPRRRQRHHVRTCRIAAWLIDLQIFRHKDVFAEIDQWRPDIIAFSLNYLAYIPEVADLAKDVMKRLPDFSFSQAGTAWPSWPTKCSNMATEPSTAY